VDNAAWSELDEGSDDDAMRGRRSVARAADQRAKLEAAERKAASVAANRRQRRLEVAEAITTQGLTVEELAECIDLGSDFCWVAPLSRTAAIEHLGAATATSQQQTESTPQLETDTQQQQPLQQQQQHEQQHEHPHESQQHPSKIEAVDSQQSNCDSLDLVGNIVENDVAEHRPTITELAVQADSCTSAVHYDLASEGSDGSNSVDDPAAGDADDAFWWNELLSAEADEQHEVGVKRPGPPSEDGSVTGKRHRPG